MRVCFELLGHVRARAGGTEVDLGPAQRQAVLVALLMSATPVTTDQLAHRVWDGRPPAGAAGTLRAHLSRLRGAVGDGARIERGHHGYVLHTDESDLDVSTFRSLVARARAADDARAAELFDEAMALWRGEPFAGLHGGWIEQARHALERELHAARLDHNNVRLRLGRYTELLASSSEDVAAHPHDERLRAQHLLALHRTGQQAEALRQYENFRAWLADELGVDPGRELRELHQRMLRADVRAAGFGCHVPPAVPDFVGRDREIAELLAGAPGLAVISGPAGVGKSALAATVAHRLRTRFPDGQLYVRAGTPFDTLGALLLQCGVPAFQLPATPAARTALLRGKLTDRQVLLVIDDVQDAGQLADVLPGCATLITSRSLLATTPVSLRLRLEPLRENESVRLLTHLAGAHRAAAEPTALRDIAAACGHLPLALRIAGARLTALPTAPLAALAERLRDHDTRLDELDVGGTSVRAEIALSYTRLREDDRAALRWLGTLPGNGFTERQLSALTGRRDVGRTLERLCDASLVDPGGVPEFRLHDLLGDFLREQARQIPSEVRRAGLRRLLKSETNRRLGPTPAAVGF